MDNDKVNDPELNSSFGENDPWFDHPLNIGKMYPNVDSIKKFDELLKANPREEELQVFLEKYPDMLFGLVGMGDESDLAFLTKPSIGSRMRADFGLLSCGQGGCTIHLVEIEPVNVNLFDKKGGDSMHLKKPIIQVTDWMQWIQKNRDTFIRDTIDYAKALPMFPNKSKNNSFKLKESGHIHQLWEGFGGYDSPLITYTVIIGDLNDMSKEEIKRLTLNNSTDARFYKIYTYRQIARKANKRILRYP